MSQASVVLVLSGITLDASMVLGSSSVSPDVSAAFRISVGFEVSTRLCEESEELLLRTYSVTFSTVEAYRIQELQKAYGGHGRHIGRRTPRGNSEDTRNNLGGSWGLGLVEGRYR